MTAMEPSAQSTSSDPLEPSASTLTSPIWNNRIITKEKTFGRFKTPVSRIAASQFTVKLVLALVDASDKTCAAVSESHGRTKPN